MAAFSATRKKPISRLDSMTLRSWRNLEGQTLAELRRVYGQRAHFLMMNAPAEERRPSGDGERPGDEHRDHHLQPARTHAAPMTDEERDDGDETRDARSADEKARSLIVFFDQRLV